MAQTAALRVALVVLAAVVPATDSYAFYMVSSHCDQSMLVGSTIMGKFEQDLLPPPALVEPLQSARRTHSTQIC